MKIKKLGISNFRGFENVEITFSNNNFHVFIGVNGAGKTSILDLLVRFFIDWAEDIYAPALRKKNKKKLNEDWFYFSERDFNFNQTSILTTEFIPLSILGIPYISQNSVLIEEKNKNISLKHWNTKMLLLYPITSEFQNSQTTEEKQAYLQEFLQNPNASVPIIAYYQVKNTEKNNQKKITKIPISQLAVYQNVCIFLENYDAFTHWFKEQEDFENQEKVNQENLQYRNPPLEIVRQAIETFFGEIEKGNAIFKDLKVERQQQDTFNFETNVKTATLTIKKNNDIFALENLSSGEKHILLLVCDIARRLSIANPSYSPIQALKEGEGVILIDEIEQHLHPKWQRNIAQALQKTFPNIFFIATTHSPQVLSGVKKESVFVLDNFQISAGKFYTEQRDSNSILEDVFQLPKYSTEIKQKIDDFYAFLENNIEKAEQILNELKQKFGENDREIRRAEMYLEDEKENISDEN